MKTKTFFSLLLLLCIGFGVNAQQYDVRIESTRTTSNHGVELYIKAHTGSTFNLASSNFRFTFNLDAVGLPSLDMSGDVVYGLEYNNGVPVSCYYQTLTGSISDLVSWNLEQDGFDGIVLNDTDWVRVGKMNLRIKDDLLDPDVQFVIAPAFPPTVVTGYVNGVLTTIAEGDFINNTNALCPIPRFTSDIHDANKLTISWEDMPGANSYQFRYRPVGSSSWTTVSTTNTSIDISHNTLINNTDYEYQMRSLCSPNSPYTRKHIFNYRFKTCANVNRLIQGNTSGKKPTLKKPSIYPNPANSELFINTIEKSPISISLKDATGKVVLNELGAKNRDIHELDITDLPVGVYIVTQTFEDGTSTAERFVKSVQ